MTPTTFADYAPVLPEILLAIAAMALLMVGAFRGESSARTVNWLAVLALLVVLVMTAFSSGEPLLAMGDMFVTDAFARFMKMLVLIGSALAIVMSLDYMRDEGVERFEFPILILLATLGMMMMVSANDLMSLYLGLELQSLALYICASIKRDSTRVTEAGLKYFVLGALASGMLLYGCSLIYGFTGSTNFQVIAGRVAEGELGMGLLFGIVFLVAGLAFKISAVPFHMWTPDVYEGAPTPVTAFFAVAPKVAAIALFIRALVVPFAEFTDEWRQIIVFLSIASMGLGAFAAIAQKNIKRLMAYSSIGHVGYALVGLAAGSEEGVRGVLIYMAIYLAMTAGAFGCILSMRRDGNAVEGIADLAGLSRNNPKMALAMAIFMFSLAGIPPLAGFMGKFYVFLAAINAQLYALAIIGVLASVVGAVYYIRIIKIMYFDEPAEAFEKPAGREMSVILAGTGLFTVFFIAWPAPLVAAAGIAAKALFP